MPGALALMHRLRWGLLLAAAGVTGTLWWLVIADVMLWARWVRWTLMTTSRTLGFWPAAEQWLSGLLGITTQGRFVSAAYLLILALTFFGSQAWFLWPPRFLRRRPRVRWGLWLAERVTGAALAVRLAAAGAAGGLALGALAALLEFSPTWRRLGQIRWELEVAGEKLGASAQALFGLLLAGAVAAGWLWYLKRHPRSRHRYWHRGTVIYHAFVLSGGLLLVSGMAHNLLYGFERGFRERGTWVAMALSTAVLAWTLLPAVALVFAARTSFRAMEGACLACGYSLAGTPREPGARCPECGAAVEKDEAGSEEGCWERGAGEGEGEGEGEKVVHPENV